ncbi:MAG: glycosyltransferase family 2 protein [Proteobacteria bacterium]|nr:glycosyltransferase family 2 protein [Pseudomonadota bacterium]
MLISVIIPCFNEIATIKTVLERVHRSPAWEKHQHEIIVVDDCSTDGSRELLQGELKPLIDELITHPRNLGKGAALKSGFEASQGDLVLIQDADLEYDPAEYPVLLSPFETGQADVVFGSRFVGGDAHRVVYFWHMVGNRFLTLVSNMLSNLNLTDMETCFKVFRREIVRNIDIRESGFGVEPELTAKVAKQNVRIYEVGISYYGRTYDEGKKINWKDGLWAFWCILKYNLFG